MKRCPDCGSENENDQATCQCGCDLEAVMPEEKKQKMIDLAEQMMLEEASSKRPPTSSLPVGGLEYYEWLQIIAWIYLILGVGCGIISLITRHHSVGVVLIIQSLFMYVLLMVVYEIAAKQKEILRYVEKINANTEKDAHQ